MPCMDREFWQLPYCLRWKSSPNCVRLLSRDSMTFQMLRLLVLKVYISLFPVLCFQIFGLWNVHNLSCRPSNTFRKVRESRRQGYLLLNMQNWQRTLLMVFLRVRTKSSLTRGKRSKILLKSSWEEQSELVKHAKWIGEAEIVKLVKHASRQ